MRKQISHKALHGLLALAFLLTIVLGAFQFFGKLQATHANGISMTEYPVPTANSRPENITRGPDGNLWFTEFIGNKIGRISTSGTISEYQIPTSNSWPEGITAGPDGNLWFTEYAGDKIGRISTGGVIKEYPLPIGNSGGPIGITVGPDGNLWFTEWGNGQMNMIGRITPSGSFTEFPLPTGGSYPSGITAGSDGNLWFTEEFGNKIGRISTSGTITEYPIPTSSSTPRGITAGPDGNLWIAALNVVSMTTSGNATVFPTPTIYNADTGITAGPGSTLWFTESTINQIGGITLSGTPLPSGKWLHPASGFTVQEGNTIALFVQADPAPGGAPIADVTISAIWAGSSGKICDLTNPDNNTTDHYSCAWNFVVAGSYIPAGSVTFNVTITDQNGNQVFDPGGSRTGTFKRYHPQITGAVSNYWGGYYDYGSNTLYSDVRATWKVPVLPGCGASENSQSSTWVGLGGVDKNFFGFGHLEQIGTDSDCVNSTKTFCPKDIPCYWAWWETVGPDSGPNGIAFVKPGDTIAAEVQYKGGGMYHLSISDNGKVLFSKDVQGSSGTIARNAADWIVEDPNGVTLANYGTITFTGCSVNGKPITYGPTLVYTVLSSQQNNQLESVSVLNGIDNGFSVKWMQSQ